MSTEVAAGNLSNRAPSTGLRPHVALVGRRNSGKSSLVNAITGLPLSIVSATPGTTTDPVSRSFELLPFGPVVFVDTAGMDDEGELGAKRVERAKRAAAGADVVLLVAPHGEGGEAEVAYLRANARRALLVATFDDAAAGEGGVGAPLGLSRPVGSTSDGRAGGGVGGDAGARAATGGADVEGRALLLKEARRLKVPIFPVSNLTGSGISELKRGLIARLTELAEGERTLLQDLVREYRLVLLIVPVDLEAPKGRLILPQVQAIREVLDGDSAALVVKERELDWVQSRLAQPPDLAITDSQVVLKVAGSLAPSIPLTTFSIIFSRLKGDLALFAENVRVIDRLTDSSRVLLVESCAHHANCDDIGRVKIPRWLKNYTGRDPHIEVCSGELPDDLATYDLVIHCGGCMITRSMMLANIDRAKAAGVPITNYGIAISYLQGVLDRVLVPFARELPRGDAPHLSR